MLLKQASSFLLTGRKLRATAMRSLAQAHTSKGQQQSLCPDSQTFQDFCTSPAELTPRRPTKSLESRGQEKSLKSVSQTALCKILEMAICSFPYIFNDDLWNSYCMPGPSPVSSSLIVNKTDTSKALFLGCKSTRLADAPQDISKARYILSSCLPTPTQNSTVPSAC